MDKKQPISVGLYYQKVYVHYKDGTDETIEFDNIKDAFEKYSDINSQIPHQIVEQQYNAVVAQNRSLQGELRLRQQMIDYLLTADILSTQSFSSESDFNSYFCKEYERIEQICIQELEAENGLH